MWTPAVPQELDDRNHDGKANATDCAKNGDARETDDRKPELLALNPIESAQTRHLDQADRRGDDDACQRRIGKMLQEARSGDQEEGDGKRAHNPGQLRPRSRRFRHRSARRTAADGKSLEKSGGEVCGAESTIS